MKQPVIPTERRNLLKIAAVPERSRRQIYKQNPISPFSRNDGGEKTKKKLCVTLCTLWLNYKQQKMNKNIPYYLASVGLFVILKVGFTFADNNDLIFWLKPTDKLVGMLIGSQSVYTEEYGFFHEKMNIVIGKSCLGFNFWILSFLVFAYLGFKYFDKHLHKILTIPTALFGAYLLTIFANTSRIFAAIIVRNQTVGIFPDQQPLIHEAVGIITKFSFLILAYYLIEKFLKHKIKHNYAKPA